MNSRSAKIHKKEQEHKMAEKLKFFEIFEKFSALFSTKRPSDDWPDALDHLAIGLVAKKIYKTWKNKWKFGT